MKIRLKGELHPELLMLGLKEGDVVEASNGTPPTDSKYFTVYGYAVPIACAVGPDNYEMIEP